MDHEPPPPPSPPPAIPPGVYPHQPLAYHHAVGGPRTPTGVMVLSILGIVLASVWLLVGAYGLMMGAGAFVMSRAPGFGPGVDGMLGYLAWESGTAVVRGLMGILLMVVSIACLRMAPWGRAGMVRYAQVDLAWIALKLILAVVWAIPQQRAMFNSMMTMPGTTLPSTTAPSSGATTTPTATTTPGPTSMIPVGSSSAASVSVGYYSSSTVVTTPGGASAAATLTGATAGYEIWLYAQAALMAVVSAIFPIIVWVYMTRRRVREAFHGMAPPPHS